MKQHSTPLPFWVLILWCFICPVLIGFLTQNVFAFWIFSGLFGVSYFLYARNFYVIKSDANYIYLSNPHNIWANKHKIPLTKIQSFDFHYYAHRRVITITTAQNTFFIPCYRCDSHSIQQFEQQFKPRLS